MNHPFQRGVGDRDESSKRGVSQGSLHQSQPRGGGGGGADYVDVATKCQLNYSKITYVMAEINFKVSIFTLSVAKITFKVAVVTSSVVEITFVVAEITFKLVAINSSVI